jgi:hypothetical protein
MHPYLEHLGIGRELQEWLAPHLLFNSAGNLIFPYHNEQEIFTVASHRIPNAVVCWAAASRPLSQVKYVVIGHSALELVAWAHLHRSAYTYDDILLIATGSSLSFDKRRYLQQTAAGKTALLVFSNDLLGAIWDIKIAAALKRQAVSVSLDSGKVQIIFRHRLYSVPEANLSLNAFSKICGYRFTTATSKPHAHITWLDFLQAGTI